MGIRIYIKGRIFERLTAIEEVGKNTSGQLLWKCRCSCNNERIIDSASLIRGNTRSCGCLRKERFNNRKHGLSYAPIYKSWYSMIQRCENENHENYKNYGAR